MKVQVCILGVVALVGYSTTVSAQLFGLTTSPSTTKSANPPEEVVVRPAKTGDAVHEIRIRNVTASVMAHWLEPNKVSRSTIDQQSIDSWLSSGHDEEDAPQLRPVLDIKLPEGVYITRYSEVTPYSGAKNAIEIAGSLDNLQRAENLIHQIDQPLEQVEVEAKLVLLGQREVNSLGLQWNFAGETLAGHPMQEAKVNADYKNLWQQIQVWDSAKKAKIFTAPRAVALVNGAHNLRSGSVTTSTFDYQLPNQTVTIGPQTPGVKNLASFASFMGMMAAPEVVTEDAVRARVQLSRVLALLFQNRRPFTESERQALEVEVKENRLPKTTMELMSMVGKTLRSDANFLGYGDGVEKVITLKDNEIMAFTGFDTDAFLDKPATKAEAAERRGKTLVAFVRMQALGRLNQIAALPQK